MNSDSCLTALCLVIQVEVRGSRSETKGVFALRNQARSEIKKGAASVGLRNRCVENRDAHNQKIS